MFNYCKDLVRKLDYEGYLVLNSIFRKNNAKLSAAMAIKAFDAEIATISHSVRTPEAAAVRYEFWRSALKRIKAKKSVEGHPVLEELSIADLTPVQLSSLETSLDARALNMDRKIFTLEDLDGYAEMALVPVLSSIQSLASEADTLPENSISHLGKAQLIVRRLRGLAKALRLNSSSAEQFIPTGLLGASGLNGSSLIKVISPSDASSKTKLSQIVQEMAAHSHAHLSSSSQLGGDNSRFCKLTHYTISRYLDALKRHDFDVLNQKVQITGSSRDGLLPFRLFFK